MGSRFQPTLCALGLALGCGLLGGAMQTGRIDPKIVVAPLHQAIAKDDVEAVRSLLDGGENPDRRTRGGLTGLGLAVALDKWEVAELLRQRGSDLNARVYGMSLIRECALSGDWDGYDWLVAHGVKADPDTAKLYQSQAVRDQDYKPFPKKTS